MKGTSEWTEFHERHSDKIEIVAGIDCWIWLGCAHPSGHGRVSSRSGHNYAHRAAYEAYTGAIPEKALIRHMCGCSSCVRPSHLRPGTSAENAKDMSDMQNTASKLTHDDVRKLRQMYDNGFPLHEIANYFGIAYGTVYPIVIYKSFRHVDPERMGKHNRRVTSRVTDEQIVSARGMISEGMRNADIARKLGIAGSAVSNIRTGARYANRP